MKKSDEDKGNGKMRKKAEQLLKTRNKKSDYSLTESDALKLIHALEVHQIELELQNEELRAAKNELASVSNKYTDLYDFAPNGYFTLSKEGKILESNLNGAKLLGKTKSELANSQFGFFVEKNSIDDFTQFLQKVFTSLAQVNIEIVLSINKNQNRTIYLTGIANENRDECFVSVVDTTEKKLAEESLKLSEKKFKNIFNNSVVGKSITEFDGRLKVNKAFSQIVGYSQEELNQMKWQEFTHPDDVEKNEEITRSIVSGKIKTARWEKRYIHKKGHIVWVDISSTLQPDEEGQPQFLITSIADITERKQAEKELREYKDLFSLFMQHSPVYTFIKEVSDTKCWVIQASDNYKDMVGLPGSEMIGKTMEELFPPEFAENITADDLAAVKEGKVVQVDENFNNRNYTTIKFPLAMGNRKLLAGYTIDITDRKKAEEEILKSYKLLNNLTSMVPGVVYQYRLYPDGHSAFPYSSPGIYEIYEVMPEDVKEDASTVFTRIHPDDYDKIEETINESAKNQTLYHSEFRVILPKQGLRWLLCDAKPQLLEDGSTLWHGIISDITERKKTEEILRENGRKTRALLDAVPDMIFRIDREGTYLDYKADKTNLYIQSDETIIGKKNRDITPPEFADMAERYIQQTLDSEEIQEFEYQMPIPKHGLRDYEARMVASGTDEVIVFVRDITERKQMELQLIRAKEKAEESDRLKSAFLANMSHEIRTPMNGILGFTNLLQDPELTGEEQQKYIGIIQKSGDRMLNTVNDIINISKIEAGQMTVLISEFSIDEQLKTISSFFKPETDKKGIQFILKNSLTEQDAVIESDKEKLNSILTNLVKNAIKFCDKGKIEIGCSKKENELQFYVKDSGIGIPRDRQQAIFERFVQADIEDKNAMQGSGLGLAISKAYTELLSGKIWVESEEGVGSTFFFTIPFVNEMADKE